MRFAKTRSRGPRRLLHHPMIKFISQASVPRDAIPPIPPGPEGSNGNGLVRVQWVPGAWLLNQSGTRPFDLLLFSFLPRVSGQQ